MEGAFQSLAGERGDAETTSAGGKWPVASPAMPPPPRPDTHAETSCLIPLAPGSPHPQHDQAHGILSRATPVSQQESPQTGASALVPRPETTPDLSSWAGTGTMWVEEPPGQDSWGEAVS